jgi:hypothetical protein
MSVQAKTRIGKKEYIPSHIYEINKYLTEYIYSIRKNFTLEYSYHDEDDNTTKVFSEEIKFIVRKGPGYETNAPKLVSRHWANIHISEDKRTETDYTMIEFMSPELLYASYSEILEVNFNVSNEMVFAYNFFTCGDLGGPLKIVKSVDPNQVQDVGVFNLVATLSIQAPDYDPNKKYKLNDMVSYSGFNWTQIFDGILVGDEPAIGSLHWHSIGPITDTQEIVYYNYHVDPVVNDLTDIKDIDWDDFLLKSPDLQARLCALRDTPVDYTRQEGVTDFSIFDKFLKDSSLFNNLSTEKCTSFIKDYCINWVKTKNDKYRRPCSCLTEIATEIGTVYFDNDKYDEEGLYYALKEIKPDIPVKCVSSYCRKGGYYNNSTEKCPNMCEPTDELCEVEYPSYPYPNKTVVKGQCCIKTYIDQTKSPRQHKILFSEDQIVFVPSPEEIAEAHTKQDDLIAQEKKNQDAEDEKNKKIKDAEDEKNKSIVNNFLNIQRNISSQKFTLIISIIIIFMFFLGSVFLLYKIINKKK